MTEILISLQSMVAAGIPKVTLMALGLLFVLMVIDFTFSVLQSMASGGDILTLIVQKTLNFGVWVWIIKNYMLITDSIKLGFVQIGMALGQGDINYISDPSALLTLGQSTIGNLLFEPTRVFDVSGQIIIFIMAIIIYICYFSIALNIFLQNAFWSMFIPLFLPLLATGVWHRTAFLSQAVISAIFNLGMRFSVYALLIGFVSQFLPTGKMVFETQVVFGTLNKLLLISIFVWKAPEMASGFLAGAAPNLNSNQQMKKMASLAGSAVSGGIKGAMALAKTSALRSVGKTASEQYTAAAQLPPPKK